MCGVAQHAEDTPGRNQAPTPGNDGVALQNETTGTL